MDEGVSPKFRWFTQMPEEMTRGRFQRLIRVGMWHRRKPSAKKSFFWLTDLLEFHRDLQIERATLPVTRRMSPDGFAPSLLLLSYDPRRRGKCDLAGCADGRGVGLVALFADVTSGFGAINNDILYFCIN